MKVTVTKRGFDVDIYELIEDMPDDGLLTLADAIAVRDDVIKYVTQQILDGWTDLESRAGMACTAEAEPKRGLDWAVREVAKRSGEVAANEVLRLEAALKYEKQETDRLRNELSRRRNLNPNAF